MKKDSPFIITEVMKEVFESAKKAMGNSILLNSFDVKRRSLVITDASASGFGYILMQKTSNTEFQARITTRDNEGRQDKDSGWVVNQVGSAALKPAWRNYSAIELEATYAVWPLESLGKEVPDSS